MSILEKNLEGIFEYNKILAEKIKSCEITNIEKFQFMQATSGDTILVYDGLALHDTENPQQEAIHTLQLINNSPKTICVIVGLGLGYLFKRFLLDFKGTIILYEPNLEILRFTFEVVDFSEELKRTNVRIVNSLIELTTSFEQIYQYNNNLSLSGLPASVSLYSKEITELKSNMNDIVYQAKSNMDCLFEQSYTWSQTGLYNIYQIKEKGLNINALKDIFKEKPAIIISSGPSLWENIETLKEHKDKFTIFCVSNSYKALVSNGIIPDFLVFTDAYSAYIIKEETIDKTHIILQNIADYKLFDVNDDKKIVYYSDNELLSKWLSKECDFELPEFSAKGTVSYCALASAAIMGCNPIVLLGQDLSYKNGEIYSKGSSFYSAMKCIFNETTQKYEIKVDDKDAFLRYVDVQDPDEKHLQTLVDIIESKPVGTILGQNGELLATNPQYIPFLRYFEDFAYTKPEINLINSSIGGAQINGFKNIPLRDVVCDLKPEKNEVYSIVKNIGATTQEPIAINIKELAGKFSIIANKVTELVPKAEKYLNSAKRLKKELKNPRPNVNTIKTTATDLFKGYAEFKDELFSKYIFLNGSIFKELFDLSSIMDDDESANSLNNLFEIATKSECFYSTFLTRTVHIANLCKSIYDSMG